MKLVLAIVSIFAVFTANCRDLPNGPDEQDSTDRVQLFSDEPEDRVNPDDPQNLDYSDEDLETKEEEGETESMLRRSKCKARNACVVMGGFCVTNATLCNARLVPEGCKGTNCQCCVPEPVNQCVGENAMKDTVNEGTDNVTRALEIKFNNLETELVTINNNATNSIKESVNQCVDETAMKETVNEGSNNVTRALEMKINRLETELQAIKNNVNNSMKGCPEGFMVLTSSTNQCLKVFRDRSYTWFTAKAKCESEGMVMAKPYDPVKLRSYLVTRYGHGYCWIGARGDGSYFRWDRDNVLISSSNPYWYTNHPGSHVSNSYCLRLEAGEGDWKNCPEGPYWRASCISSGYALCELIMS